MIHEEQINNKLLVLFILEKFEMPMSEPVLLEICSIDNPWIPYLLCKQIILELIDTGFAIGRLTEDGVPLLSLTSDGHNCLAHFYRDIPASIREDITDFVKLNRMSYRKKQDFVCSEYKNDDGSYTVCLKILEVTKPVLEVKIVVDNRQTATEVCNGWGKNAPTVFNAVHDVLMGDK